MQLSGGSSDGQEITMNRNANVLFLRHFVLAQLFSHTRNDTHMTVTHLGDELQHFLRGFADSRQSGVGPQGLQPREKYDKHNMPITFWQQLFSTNMTQL